MAKADPRPPKVILESITNQAEKVREAAAELTKRIEHFQQCLGKIPGRVETDYYGADPDADNAEDHFFQALVIRLHRTGKNWTLSYAFHDERRSVEESGPFTEFKALVDAPLRIKIAAVKMFPNILAAIEMSQKKLVTELEAAAAEYDAFAATLRASHVIEDHPGLLKRDPQGSFIHRDSQGHFIQKDSQGRSVARDNLSNGVLKKEGK
jgi:hypothetical protein